MRWAVVLLVLAVVVAGIAFGIRAIAGALGGGGADDTPDPAPATSEAAAEPTSDPATPAECSAEGLTVELASDAGAYSLGQTAVFTLTLTNVGEAPCTIDAGRTAAQLVVTSGADRVWSSADCEPGDPRLLLLDAGSSDVSAIEWATNRSAPECPTDLPPIGAGTYQATVTTSTTTTEPLVFTVS